MQPHHGLELGARVVAVQLLDFTIRLLGIELPKNEVKLLLLTRAIGVSPRRTAMAFATPQLVETAWH
jgi:hypothetical protein